VTGHQAAPTGAGSVILDLGGSTGALVLDAPAGLHGREIEISPAGDAGARRTHALVRQRDTGAGSSYAAVYPGLAAGDYPAWRDSATPAGTGGIDGGRVARVSLR